MFSTMKRRSAVVMLLIATLAWGCESGTTTESTTGLEQIEAGTTSNLLGGVLKTILSPVATVVEVVGEVGDAVIGPVGGILSVQDHDLTVLPGAVPHPAVFRMEILSGDQIVVDLTATDAETGEDVGEKGFGKPVQLALSYANADISEGDIDKLVIVRIHDDGTREKLPSTVNRETQQVTAELDHFSKYGLCRN